jgi:hypothetical protein
MTRITPVVLQRQNEKRTCGGSGFSGVDGGIGVTLLWFSSDGSRCGVTGSNGIIKDNPLFK